MNDGPSTISLGSGTQLSVKLASFAALNRFANITGTTVPEFYSGVGDLPTGVYTTLGKVYCSDTMASVYKAKHARLLANLCGQMNPVRNICCGIM